MAVTILRSQVPTSGNAIARIFRQCIEFSHNHLHLWKETRRERDPQKRSAALEFNSHFITIFRNCAAANTFSNELRRIVLHFTSLSRRRFAATH